MSKKTEHLLFLWQIQDSSKQDGRMVRKYNWKVTRRLFPCLCRLGGMIKGKGLHPTISRTVPGIVSGPPPSGSTPALWTKRSRCTSGYLDLDLDGDVSGLRAWYAIVPITSALLGCRKGAMVNIDHPLLLTQVFPTVGLSLNG